MLTGIAISRSPPERARLVEIASNGNSPQKHVLQGQIVLLSVDGVDTNKIMRVEVVAVVLVPLTLLRTLTEPAVASRFGTDALAADAARRQTRQEQLDDLREAFGFRM